MMPSTTAAIARETGYRDAIPSMPTSVRGLAQQSQDVRDQRSLDLELTRKKLLWEEQQATANVAMLQARGASASAIAQARQQEADARKNTEDMRQVDLAFSAQQRTRPVNVKGLGVVTPRFGVDLEGGSGSEGGLRARVVPQSPMGRQGGTGGGRGGAGGGAGAGAGEAPTGDVLTLVVQTRDRNKNAVGPSQPRRYEEGPTLWRSVAASPVDYGMNAAQAAAYKESYRAFNAALPAARKGDETAFQAAMKAQDAMRSTLMAGQAQYAPAVAGTREGFGTSQRDEELNAIRSDQAAMRDLIAQQGRARGQAKIAGGAIADTASLALPPEVTLEEVRDLVAQDAGIVPGKRERYQSTVDGSTLERAEYEAALRMAPMPEYMVGGQADLYKQVAQQAQDAKTKLLVQKNSLREKRLRAIVTELSADTDDPVGYLEGLGVVVPESLKPAPLPQGQRPAAPRAAPRPAPAPQPAAAPTTPTFASREDAMTWLRSQPWTAAQKVQMMDRIKAQQGF
jgi:hypothetical protein